jgi:hypothetical protein
VEARLMPFRYVARHVFGLGPRGQVLCVLGFVWILVGVSVLTTPSSPTPGVFLEQHLPAWARGVLWIGTGVAGIVAAWWPPGRDHWGFTALVAMPLARFTFYTLSTIFWLLPDIEGHSRAWVSAAVWGAIAEFIMIVAGWPEPPKRCGPDR